MRNALRFLLAGSVSVALLAACGGGTLSQNEGRVRLLNATAELGTVDLYESSHRVSSGIAPYATGDYEKLDKGSYDFSLRGGTAGATIATVTASVKADDHLTLVAYSNAGTPTLAAVVENENEPDKGSAKLRFFNAAATDVGNVDAYLVAANTPCSDLASVSATAVATGVSGLQTVFTQINPSGSTAYHLCVTAAGDKDDVRLDSSLAVGDRQVLTVVLSRSPSGQLLNGFIVVQEGNVTQALNASARVRIAVGVGVGKQAAATIGTASLGVPAPSSTVGAYTQVSATATQASVAITDSTGTTTVTPTIALTAGADYTLLVTGNATTPVTLLIDNNALSTNATKPAKIRLVNGANRATAGNLGPASLTVGSIFVGTAELGAASGYTLVEASGATATVVEVKTTGGTVLCTGSASFTATPTVFSVFVLGDLSGTPVGPCLIRADR